MFVTVLKIPVDRATLVPNSAPAVVEVVVMPLIESGKLNVLSVSNSPKSSRFNLTTPCLKMPVLGKASVSIIFVVPANTGFTSEALGAPATTNLTVGS